MTAGTLALEAGRVVGFDPLRNKSYRATGLGLVQTGGQRCVSRRGTQADRLPRHFPARGVRVTGQAALTAGAAESAGWTEKSSGKQPVRGSGGTRPTGAPTAPAVSVVPCGREAA